MSNQSQNTPPVNSNNKISLEQSNLLLSFLITGLIAFAENDWKYPYPSTLLRARGLLYGALIQQGKWKFASISDFIRQMQAPIRTWWPYENLPEGIDPDGHLVNEELQIPIYVEELLLDIDELSETQKFNAAELKLVLENRRIKEALQKARDDPELEKAYVELRRFIIEHPWINVENGIEISQGARHLMGNLTDFYEAPSINMRHDGKYWLCPRCQGILIWANDQPRCANVGLCDRLVDFRQAETILGDIRTLKMTFRKRVQLPGLAELALYTQLSQCPDVDVQLWPNVDQYDLSVKKNGKFHWAIDVKDYASEFSLSALIRKNPSHQTKGTTFIYAIPDHREQINRGYIARLRKLSPGSVQIRLVSDLIQEAKK